MMDSTASPPPPPPANVPSFGHDEGHLVLAVTALLLALLWGTVIVLGQAEIAKLQSHQASPDVLALAREHLWHDRVFALATSAVIVGAAAWLVSLLRRRVTVEAAWRQIQARERHEQARLASEQRARELAQLLEQRVEERTRELRQREATLRLVIENTPVMLGYFDQQRRLVFANTAYARLLGQGSATAVIGRHEHELMSPRTAALHEPLALRAFAGETVAYEVEAHGRTGRAVLMLTLTPDIDESRSVRGVFASLVDVTEQRRREDDLRASHALLREREHELQLVTDHIPAFLARFDANRVCRFVNAAYARVVGRPAQQLLGRPVDDVVPAERLAQQAAAIEAVLQGQPQQYEVRHPTHAQGGVDVHLVPYRNADGVGAGWFAFAFDITERKLAEAALRRSNADLEQFAYSISHDLRSPLRAISGHLHLLARSLGDRLDDDERVALGFALDGAQRLDTMIVSLLDYSRIGRQPMATERLSTGDVLQEALGFLAPAMQEASATVSVEGEWPEVRAVRPELSRLLQNLIGNALKFRRPGCPAQVRLCSAVTDTHWLLEVHDDGVGFEPTQADRLFRLFSRLHTRSEFEGSGMGLALCRRIVERHHARISATSSGPQQGSCFVVEWPRAGLPPEHA